MTIPSIEPSEVGFTGLLWLVLSYGFVLYKASELIAHGSELLLLVPSLAGIVGGVVLPLLGSVPDGAIMLVSGLGPREYAQESLSVGVGALAGSTIMVLTVPFGLSVLMGRVDMTSDGTPNYYGRPKLSEGKRIKEHLFQTGISVSPAVNRGIMIMIMTTIPYFLIEIPLMLLPSTDTEDEIAAGEKIWAEVGFCICVIGFLGYMKVQFDISRRGEDEFKRLAVMKKLLGHGTVSLRGALYDALKLEEKVEKEAKMEGSYAQMLEDQTYYTSAIVMHYLEEVLKEPFNKYDTDHSGRLSKGEVRTLLNDMQENVTEDTIEILFSTFDRSKTGSVGYSEFCEVMYSYIKKNYRAMNLPSQSFDLHAGSRDGEEEEELPKDIAKLSPKDQQLAIKKKAALMLFSGCCLVIFFAEPAVEVMNEISNRLNLSPFYVSFTLVPLTSNLCEVIASIYYSSKKTSKSMTVALSSLAGAAAMNNTLCLSLFMGLIVFRGIAWEYTAETAAIVVVEAIVGAYATKSKIRTIDGYVILSLYPLSLGLVVLLNHLGFD